MPRAGRSRATRPRTTSLACRTHGVGPWPGGRDEWPDDPRYDPDLLEHGDTRNVIDRYRYWRLDAIVADLDEHRHPFHVAIENWQHDMNIGSIVRTANAFAAETVHIIGRRRWNKRGAMVTDRYQHVLHHPDVADFVDVGARAASCPIIAVDNVEGSCPIETFELPERCVLLFGQEGPGLSDRGDSPRPTSSSRSPSSGRPGRSTRAPRPRSSCTSGCAGTPVADRRPERRCRRREIRSGRGIRSRRDIRSVGRSSPRAPRARRAGPAAMRRHDHDAVPPKSASGPPVSYAMPESAAAIVAVSSPNARMRPCDAPARAAGTACAIAAAAPMNASA